MHKAAWRQDIDHNNALIREATYAATEAQGHIACLTCGRPADVYMRCDHFRFSASQCDSCASERAKLYAVRSLVVTYDGLHCVPLVAAIDGIDLPQLVVECLDCAVGDHSIRAVQDVPSSVAAVVVVLTGKIHRELRPSEQAAVIAATRTEFVRRIREKRAQSADIGARLASPYRMFAQRAG